ncbi:MAG: response regulator [Holophagales bacterium]|nr:MAG: response regulator [Holophagales bacterium]
MRERILIIDDEPSVRELLAAQVSFLGFEETSAGDGREGFRLASLAPHPELVLLDLEMPGLSGLEVLRWIKALDEDIQVVVISGLQDLETVRLCLRDGAYDYLVKPFVLEDLGNTISRALERGRLIRQNREYRENLERIVAERTHELKQTRDIAILTLAKLAESRDDATGQHLERMAAYSRRLAAEVAQRGARVDNGAAFVEQVAKSSPLHDIGKVGIPDAILRKRGTLTPAETAIMRTHTTIGGDTLHSVIEKFSGHTFLTMAMEIAYFHHERWDGSGYPAALSREDIPLPARIVALADAYDAITSDRPYKGPLPHAEALRRIRADRGAHFDPEMVDAFLDCERDFAAIALEFQVSAEPTVAAEVADA